MTEVLYIASRANTEHGGFWSPVGRLEHLHGLYRFRYTKGAETLEGFQPFPGMPDVAAIYESGELFPLFANRLLSTSRPEYEAFLRWGGFDPAVPPHPLAVLSVTQGLRQTDWLEVFPCPSPQPDGRYMSRFFLHGVRWMHPAAQARIAELEVGDKLRMSLEVGNPTDESAVNVMTTDVTGRLLIGYVPRYLARDFRQLVEQCESESMELTVARLNKDAPLQQRVLCKFTSCWPSKFHPCGAPEFQPVERSQSKKSA